MRSGVKMVIAGVAFIAAVPAVAAPTVARCDSGVRNSPTGCNIVFDGLSGNYGNPNVSASPFVDIYNFTLASAGVLGLTLQSIGAAANSDINFSLVRLNPPGGGNNVRLVDRSTGNVEFYSLSDISATAGDYALRLEGSVAGPAPNAAYSGTISFAPGAVPEPAAWAMMILGMGAIGIAMRRQKRPSGSQALGDVVLSR